MNAVQNFAFEEHLVRVVDRDGEPWFVGKDVCNALSISKHRDALSTLDPDERASSTTDPLGAGGAQEMTVVSEPGVYRLVFRSRKPEAERFKRWLAHEVLPRIRRTGRFGPEERGAAAPGPEDREGRALRMVTEARLIFGRAAAARLWDALGLPPVPPAPPDTAPLDCLAHLLAMPVGAVTLREMLPLAFDGVRQAQALLADSGVRVEGEAFVVASRHPALARRFAGTPWRPHAPLLRRLEGAAEARVMRFGMGLVSRGVALPGWYATPASVTDPAPPRYPARGSAAPRPAATRSPARSRGPRSAAGS